MTVDLVPSAVKPSQTPDAPRRTARRGAPWLVLALYLAGAVALTWRLWADPASRIQIGDVTDVNLFSWFIRYSAESVAHGSLPALVTTAMNAPHGINLMWNTSLLLPGVLLTPVTLLAGPQTTLTLLLTLGFAGSAASLYWVLRRWGVRIGPAALGGAVYGFSPALLAAAVGHYHLEFAVLPPLLIDAMLRIVTGRGHALKTGAWLGLLAAAQFFIGEELLVDTVFAAGVVLVVLILMRPGAVAGQAGRSAAGLAVAAGIALVICSYALWVQFHGPLAQHGNPWKANHFRNRAAAFVTPAGNMLLHTSSGAAAIARHPAYVSEYVAYLGYPLLVVLIVAAVRYWRDLRVRVAAVACAVLEILSFGGTQVIRGSTVPPALLPWHWLANLPVISQMLPDRLSLLADGLAAVVLAVSLDLALSAAALPRWRRVGVPVAIAAIAVLPLIPLPLHTTQAAGVPAGYRTAFARLALPRDARVLVVPVPYGHVSQPLRWYADTGYPGSMNGGYFIGPNRNGKAMGYGGRRAQAIAKSIDALWHPSSQAKSPTAAQMRSYLARWRPAAVVAVTRRGSRLGQLLTRVLGLPTFSAGRVLVWRR
ncbi:MAG TPA: hypothetical protein VIF35_12250 [Streptosporangiaceae bacterium]